VHLTTVAFARLPGNSPTDSDSLNFESGDRHHRVLCPLDVHLSLSGYLEVPLMVKVAGVNLVHRFSYL
jgi:hypothetical protein